MQTRLHETVVAVRLPNLPTHSEKCREKLIKILGTEIAVRFS